MKAIYTWEYRGTGGAGAMGKFMSKKEILYVEDDMLRRFTINFSINKSKSGCRVMPTKSVFGESRGSGAAEPHPHPSYTYEESFYVGSLVLYTVLANILLLPTGRLVQPFTSLERIMFRVQQNAYDDSISLYPTTMRYRNLALTMNS